MIKTNKEKVEIIGLLSEFRTRKLSWNERWIKKRQNKAKQKKKLIFMIKLLINTFDNKGNGSKTCE